MLCHFSKVHYRVSTDFLSQSLRAASTSSIWVFYSKVTMLLKRKSVDRLYTLTRDKSPFSDIINIVYSCCIAISKKNSIHFNASRKKVQIYLLPIFTFISWTLLFANSGFAWMSIRSPFVFIHDELKFSSILVHTLEHHRVFCQIHAYKHEIRNIIKLPLAHFLYRESLICHTSKDSSSYIFTSAGVKLFAMIGLITGIAALFYNS